MSGPTVPALPDVVGYFAWQYSPYGGSPLHHCLELIRCLPDFDVVDTVAVVVVVVLLLLLLVVVVYLCLLF